MTTGTIPDDVRTYLGAVRARLADLPAEERETLLSDAEPSLLEGEGSPYVRLGSPQRFADELRAAAGFPPPLEPSAPAAAPRALESARRLLHHPLLGELAPLWWVARAYLVLALLAPFVGRWAYGDPWVPVFHNARETLALGFVAVAASMAVGLRRRPPRPWVVALNVAVLVVGVPVAVAETAAHARWSPPAAVVTAAPAGLSYDGRAVHNVYAYDRRGRLLQDVRLYDQRGRPLAIGDPSTDPNRRVPRTAAGRPAANAFPLRYFQPGTHRVAHPHAGAPRQRARLVTPLP